MADEAGFTCKALWALRDSSLDGADWKVAVALLSFCNADGECRPSLARLAAAARTSRGAIRRSLARLEAGLGGPLRLQVERGRRTVDGDADSHHYVLTLVGCDQRDPTCDQTDPTCDQGSPTVGSLEPDGCDQPDPTGVITQGHKEDSKEDKQEDRGKPRPKAGKRKPGTAVAMPSDWAPSDAHHAFASQHSLDLQHEAQQFRDKSEAKGWTNVSWPAAFSTWLRNQAKWNRERVGGSKPVQLGGTIRETRVF